ncbi:hypothetical protein NM688_g4728 [Phlebia brevispora]|uniref:Uncharacterized protein n=1 Tax=Phlebia brevispora TaxID=194682 RepID=A0ACC1T1U7_9APHY|nr:hypothetical protein NM688_g4728 [Phlebia brevispora]
MLLRFTPLRYTPDENAAGTLNNLLLYHPLNDGYSICINFQCEDDLILSARQGGMDAGDVVAYTPSLSISTFQTSGSALWLDQTAKLTCGPKLAVPRDLTVYKPGAAATSSKGKAVSADRGSPVVSPASFGPDLSLLAVASIRWSKLCAISAHLDTHVIAVVPPCLRHSVRSLRNL